MPQYIRSSIQTLTICLIVMVGASILYAWTGPTVNPPSNNAPAPINTGGSTQTKSGNLTVNGQITTNSNMDMNGNWITDTRGIKTDYIYDRGGGS